MDACSICIGLVMGMHKAWATCSEGQTTHPLRQTLTAGGVLCLVCHTCTL